MSSQPNPIAENEPLLVGDHPALDFLNTVARIDGVLVDSLKSDRDVARWLDASGWAVEADLAAIKAGSLLEAAQELRDTIRALVERRKAEKRVDLDTLNAYLAESRSYLKLTREKDGTLRLRRKWKQRNPEEMLAPLAESAAGLLANGDFSLVRKCENGDCVLWFYDRTKSHQRRWCSMAMCGNRHKVAAYRKRQQQSA
ncbi:MAG TPA: ABATE domain-containing protein [Acidobacteriaceae bacterium]|nr:ABATE domain-containing protein [Acidobacteriaceae bacterium]